MNGEPQSQVVAVADRDLLTRSLSNQRRPQAQRNTIRSILHLGGRWIAHIPPTYFPRHVLPSVTHLPVVYSHLVLDSVSCCLPAVDNKQQIQKKTFRSGDVKSTLAC